MDGNFTAIERVEARFRDRCGANTTCPGKGTINALQEDIILTIHLKWSKDAQEIMSSTASNYDMTKLVTGQVVATVAAIVAAAATMPTFLNSFASIIPFLLTTLTYGAMMFASSYVEEEHHFWYWAASGWLVLLSLRGYAAFN